MTISNHERCPFHYPDQYNRAGNAKSAELVRLRNAVVDAAKYYILSTDGTGYIELASSVQALRDLEKL